MRPRRVALLAAPVIAVLAVGGYVWWDTNRTHGVSVDKAVDKFRRSQPSATATALPAGPGTGVYVYATEGGEQISVGTKHTYPHRTTVTVKRSACGLTVRWDALAERWNEYDLCASGGGWRLDRVVELHKFLYLEDKQDLACGDAAVLTPTASFGCRNDRISVTWKATPAGTESVSVGGRRVQAEHIKLVSTTTGGSTNDGTVDLWLQPGTGLPVRVVVRNHGGQHVLGQDIAYDESFTLALTSLTPQR